jgi:hypothetical protein
VLVAGIQIASIFIIKDKKITIVQKKNYELSDGPASEEIKTPVHLMLAREAPSTVKIEVPQKKVEELPKTNVTINKVSAPLAKPSVTTNSKPKAFDPLSLFQEEEEDYLFTPRKKEPVVVVTKSVTVNPAVTTNSGFVLDLWFVNGKQQVYLMQSPRK